MAITTIIESAINGDKQSILLLVSAYTFLVCTYSALYQIRINGWPMVQGLLVESGISKFGLQSWAPSKQQYVAKAYYQYEVDGKKYTGTRVSPWMVVASANMRWILAKQLGQAAALPDQTVSVFYNPRNPAKSFLVKPGSVSQLVTFSIGVIPAVFYLLEFK